MKKLVCLLCICLSLSSFGQASEMLWGPELKLKGSISFIGEYNNSVFAYRSYKKTLFLESYEMESMSNNLSTEVSMILNQNVRLSLEKTYILKDGRIVILGSHFNKS